MLFLHRAVAVHFYFIRQTQAVLAIEVPGVTRKVAAGAIADEGIILFDALELGTVDKAEFAVGGAAKMVWFESIEASKYYNFGS